MPNSGLIYLASQSPRRRLLLRRAGYRCRVIESDYVEKHESACSPRILVLKHATGKLRGAQIPANAKGRFVISADTVVALGGVVYGKPANLKHATLMLGKLAGKMHDVYTGWAMLDRKTGKVLKRIVRSRVMIKQLKKNEIRNYFKKMNPLDKAGSYAVQSRPSVVVEIKGSYSNVMGFPMEDFEKAIARLAAGVSHAR